jgi:hypothetical protein
MKYTLAIVMLLGLANVEASMLEKNAKPVAHAKHAAAKEIKAESDSSDTDDDDDEGEDDLKTGAAAHISKKSAAKPSKKSLIEMEDEQNEDEEDVDEDDEDDEDEDDDEESEDDESEEDPEAKTAAAKSLVQLEEQGDDVDHSGEQFKSTESDMLGDGGYKRVTTPRYAADSDDIFMRSMIENYALEGKNKDGSPNGQFWMSEALTRSAATEVLGTHRGLKGAELQKYLTTYFPRSWAHFDVNRTGQVEVVKMPQFMRFIASDQQMYLW